jgi:hypothetical protein
VSGFILKRNRSRKEEGKRAGSAPNKARRIRAPSQRDAFRVISVQDYDHIVMLFFQAFTQGKDSFTFSPKEEKTINIGVFP